jgi:hypothetical protein
VSINDEDGCNGADRARSEVIPAQRTGSCGKLTLRPWVSTSRSTKAPAKPALYNDANNNNEHFKLILATRIDDSTKMHVENTYRISLAFSCEGGWPFAATWFFGRLNCIMVKIAPKARSSDV